MRFNRLQRREFITLLGGAAAAWPLPTQAQQPAMPVIGFLVPGTPSSHGQWITAFVQRLGELGRVERRNVAIEYRWAEGRSERYAEIADEFVRLRVDIILTAGTAVFAAKQATSIIPIVVVGMGDPIGSGIVTSLARPSGNVTGFSVQGIDIAGKRLELLREVIPDLRRLAILADIGSPGMVLEMEEVRAMARALGLEVTTLEVWRTEDIATAFDGLRGRADALYVCSNPFLFTNRIRINTLALAARLPTMHLLREYVEVGALMSYGPNLPDLFRRAGDYIDKILRGTKPGDLPVEQPTKFDLVINLTTAKALGLTIPESFLVRANEVIE
jgi:putative ABC transport system substrate-binding protein